MNVRTTLMIGIAAVALATTPSLLAAQSAKPAGQTTKPAAKSPAKPTAKPPAKPAGRGTSAASNAALRTPSKLTETAPAVYHATFSTSAGDFVVEVHRDWSPKGADRFYNLVKHGFFDDTRFFRVVTGFMVQFGINGDPSIQKHWQEANIPDDPVKGSNKRGFITFAKRGDPNSRSTQVFINFKDNAFLDGQGFSPFGQVISGMDVVDKLNPKYGGAPSEQQPRIQAEGNKFLNASFPGLDYVKKASITNAPVK